MPDMKRDVKDSVFTYLFRQPEYTRALYLSLHPEDSSVTEDEFQIVTLENILSTGQYNDLGMLVRKTLLVLVEAQSTFTVNICLRMLMYLAQSYKEYVVAHELDLYSTAAVSIPCPELYVVYTGSRRDLPETLKLSTLFPGEGGVELEVKVLRKRGTDDVLDQYIRFCEIQTEQRKLHGYTQKSVEEILRICREEGILTLFLASREKEVRDIMSTLFDQDWIMYVHEKEIARIAREEGELEGRQEGRQEGRREGRREGRQEGRREGRQEGRREGTLESLRNLMASLGWDSDQAMAALKIPASEQPEYRELLEGQ